MGNELGRLSHRALSTRCLGGASFRAEREVVVQGGEDFRPTGMAVAPDGSLYFGDWVRRSYPVHGQGRIWRLKLPHEAGQEFPQPNGEELFAMKDLPVDFPDFDAVASQSDPFLRQAAVRGAALEANEWIGWDSFEAGTRLVTLQAMRWNRIFRAAEAEHLETLRLALVDPERSVRLYALRWIADERILSLRDDVQNLLNCSVADEQHYLTVLGALDWLDHDPKLWAVTVTDGLLDREIRNQSRLP